MKEMKCPCGYKYYYDPVAGSWVVEGSKENKRPQWVSQELGLRSCPECGIVFKYF